MVGLLANSNSAGEDPMNVQDLIGSRKEVFSIPEELTVHEAARYLRDKQVRSAGVTQVGGKLAGVVSQSDISDKVAAENKCPAWMRVSEIMTRDLITVGPEATLDECLRLMEKNGVYHLLVVDNSEKFRGMLSVSDLLRVMVSDEKERADLLEAILFPTH
jgi:CBS domain-containing protein